MNEVKITDDTYLSYRYTTFACLKHRLVIIDILYVHCEHLLSLSTERGASVRRPHWYVIDSEALIVIYSVSQSDLQAITYDTPLVSMQSHVKRTGKIKLLYLSCGTHSRR